MIRPAAPADSDRIAAIYNHYIGNTTVTFEELPLTSAEVALRLQTREKTGTWLVSERNGKVVGCA